MTVGLVTWCVNLNFEWSSMTPFWRETLFPFPQALYSTGGMAAAIPPPPPSRPRKGNNSIPIFGHSGGRKSRIRRTDGPIRPTDGGRSIFHIPFPNRKSQPQSLVDGKINRVPSKADPYGE